MTSFVVQTATNSIISAGPYLLVGTGFLMAFRAARFFHFAHGIVFTSAAYLALLLFTWQVPLATSVSLAVMLATANGCLIELSVYRPLRRKGSSSLILLLSSLGIYIILQNLISLIFGDDTKSIRTSGIQEGINLLGARITPIQMTTIFVTAALVVAVAAMLKYTKVGKAMRAVAADPDLAKTSGIDSDRVILWTFAIGSALAGVAGILVTLDVDMTPTMGMNALMMGVVAVIIGGVGSISGVVLGALLIGFARNFGVWYLSSQWQDAIVFIILLVFLLFRPQGFLGKKVKKASV